MTPQAATEIKLLVEYGVCPSCGDNLGPKKVCKNRSGSCGRGWGKEYRQAVRVVNREEPVAQGIIR